MSGGGALQNNSKQGYFPHKQNRFKWFLNQLNFLKNTHPTQILHTIHICHYFVTNKIFFSKESGRRYYNSNVFQLIF